ncbi:MAG: hypothetical protein EBS37_13505 [Betaproteobacteria bacterium]|nr:hypothetical protein [Betaproteobacteria bacterium]
MAILKSAEQLLEILDILVISLQRRCEYVDFVTALFNYFMARQYSLETLEIKKLKIQLQMDQIVQMKLFI